jgi:hypothetical protein
MSDAPVPTESGIESLAAFGHEACVSYLGTPSDC